MASRTLGELLLRPSSFPTQSIRRMAPIWTQQRFISSTPRESGEPKRKEADYDLDEQSQPQPQHRTTRRRTSQAETSQAIDSLFGDMPASRPPRYTTRSAPGASSGDELRAARTSQVFGSNFSNTSRMRPSRRPPGLNFDDMAFPAELLNPTLANKPADATTSLAAQQDETFANYPRLSPTYGRTVDLDPSRGRDLVRGLGMLASLAARNRIKSDFAKQKFHERGGLKRKRLHSERWRARFKKGFQAITSRVTELTKKGW